jgi:hypothetical protein
MDGPQQHDRLAGGANDEASHPGARGSSSSGNNRRTLPSSSSSAGSKAQAHPRGSLEVAGHDPDDPADLERDDDEGEDEEEEGEDESGRMAAAGAGAAATSKGDRLSEEAMEGRVHRR